MNAYRNLVKLTPEYLHLVEQIFKNHYDEQNPKYGNPETDLNEFKERMNEGYKLTHNIYPNENFIVIGRNEFDISNANIILWQSNLNLIETYQSLGGSAVLVLEKIDKHKPSYILQQQEEDCKYFAIIEIK
jgi:hypothetical protein